MTHGPAGRGIRRVNRIRAKGNTVNTPTRTGLIALMTMAAVSAAGCAGDDPTGTTATDQMIDADLAMVAADGTIEDIQALRDARHGGYFMDGRSGSRTVQFFDAAGMEQEAYDDLTTDSIYMTMEMNREIERDGWSASVARTRELSVTGLAGNEATRTVNGFGSESITRSRHTEQMRVREREMTGTRTMENVVHAVPFEDNPWPLSGTITRQMRVTVRTEQGVQTRTREVVITFNGTQFPEMTIDGEPFEVDLAAREWERPYCEGHPHGPGGPGGPGDAHID